MDLGTIKKSITKYKTVDEFLSNVQLIWDNCKYYNADGCEIFKIAEKLETLTQKLIQKIFANKCDKAEPRRVKRRKLEGNESIEIVGDDVVK